MYDYNSSNGQRSHKVSFNRPVGNSSPNYEVWWFLQWEIQFIRWFYANLGDAMQMEFCTSVDIHADPTIVNNYKLVISVGHDEYWSWEMRDTVEDFITGGGNVAFFSANVSWWQVRFESDPNGNPNRTLVCYKDFQADKDENPTVPDDHITINWIEKIINRPENLMTGASYYWGSALWGSYDTAYKIRLQRHWLLKDTGRVYGDTFGGSLFGQHESDAADFADNDRQFPIPTGRLAHDSDDFTAPRDLMIIAAADLATLGDGYQAGLGYWSGPNYHNGWATMGIHRKRPGGFVFHGGNYNWARNGLSGSWNEFSQITKNVLEILSDDFEPQSFLLVNSGFEDGNLSGWTLSGGGSASISSAEHYEGNYSALIDATNGETYLSQKYIPIRTNRSYRIRCYAKPGLIALPSAISIRLQTLDVNNQPKDEFIIATYPVGGIGWQELSAEGMLSNADDIMLQVRIKLQVKIGQSAYFDNVVVEEL